MTGGNFEYINLFVFVFILNYFFYFFIKFLNKYFYNFDTSKLIKINKIYYLFIYYLIIIIV